MNVVRSFVTACGMFLVACMALAQSLEVIDLKYRTAEEVIPVLQPLLESGGALSGQDYTLFVRTSAANLSQLRAAIERIDRKPRQLLISVRRSTDEDMRREAASASATVRSDRAAASVNEPPRRESGVSVRGTQSDSRTQGGGVASVSVLEGASAFVSTGTSVPIVTTVAAHAGRRPWAASSTQYRELTNGFLVTPRVTGDRVVLDIEQQAERLRSGTIDSERLTTQVSSRLGEWIQLGGVEHSSTSTRRGVLSRQYSTNSDTRSIWVKVDEQ
jgi:hypothetical protein